MIDQGLLEAPAPTEEQLAQIKKHKDEEADWLRRREESWERSDTDGFLSQWALGLSSRLEEAKAELLKNGGYAEFTVLCDMDGNVIANKQYTFQNKYNYGYDKYWRLPYKIDNRQWVPVGKNSRIQKKFNLHEEKRWYPAYAFIDGKGTGLSGQAWVAIKRKDENNE